MSSATYRTASVRTRHLPRLALGVCVAALQLSSARAQTSAAQTPTPQEANAPAQPGSEAVPLDVEINDQDPESSVPSAEEAMKNPLRMGYLMMAFSDRAEAAKKAGKFAEAAKYYQAMSKAVPDRAVSYREACKAQLAAGDLRKAVENCRAALGKGGVTGADHLAFVSVMLKRPGTFSRADVNDMDAVIERLSGELGMSKDDKGRHLLAELKCQFSVRLAEADRLALCTQELERLKFEQAKVLPYAWALAVAQNNVQEAESVMQEAKRAGLPASSIAFMAKGIERAKEAKTGRLMAQVQRWWPALVAGLLAVAGLAVLKFRRRSRLNPV